MPTPDEVFDAAHEAARAAMASGRPIADAADAAIQLVLIDLEAIMCPEDHPGYDDEHVYWQDHDPKDAASLEADPFEWAPEVHEWMAERLSELMARSRWGRVSDRG
jgi:hypothetical protein